MLNHFENIMPLLNVIWLSPYSGAYLDLFIFKTYDRAIFNILKNEINSRSF